MNGVPARVALILLGLFAGWPARAAEPVATPPAAAGSPAVASPEAPSAPAGTPPVEEVPAPGVGAPAAGSPAVTAGAGAAAPQEPQALAKALFDQIRQADTYDLTTIERLYLEVMEKCPETDQAQESYWRLSNLYLQAYDQPKYPETRALLERFLARYPDSEGVPLVKHRLAFVYEEMKDWPKTVEIYSELFTAPEVPAEAVQEYGFSYAQALKNAGRVDEARVWYRRFLEAMQGQDDFRVRVAQRDLEELDEVGGAPPAPTATAEPDAEPAALPIAAPAEPIPAVVAPTLAAPASPNAVTVPSAVPSDAAAPVATPAAGAAPAVERATQMQRDASGLQGAGDYLGALQAYRQSLALRPDPQVAARVKKIEAYLKARGIDLPPAP